MASRHLANAGHEEQLQRYMPRIVSGDLITAVAVTEADAGSDVAGIKTDAERDGDFWVLNETKMFITNGAHADPYFVAAKIDLEAAGSRRRTIYAVESEAAGVSFGRMLDKMGWRSSDTVELVFEDCRVPAGNVLGEVNKDFYAIMKNFQNERLVLGPQAKGEAQKALELTLEYVRERKAFGAPLWEKQTIRQRLAQRKAEVAAARHGSTRKESRA